MPLIDIVTMRGMIPRVAGQLLPDGAAALQQVGKPHDWLGVAGVAAQRNWQDDDFSIVA